MFPQNQNYYSTCSSPYYPGTSYPVGPPPPYGTPDCLASSTSAQPVGFVYAQQPPQRPLVVVEEAHPVCTPADCCLCALCAFCCGICLSHPC